MLPRPLTLNTFVTVGQPLCLLFPLSTLPAGPDLPSVTLGVTLCSDTKRAQLCAGNATAVENVM